MNASSSSSGHPQLPTHSFKFNPSLPLLDPTTVSSLLQPPEDACTKASSDFVKGILLNLHAQMHWSTDQSNNEDFEDALEGGAVEAAHSIDPETDDLWNGEDVDLEDDVDPCEGVVSDWDILAEEFIVEAKELGKFEHSTLHTS